MKKFALILGCAALMCACTPKQETQEVNSEENVEAVTVESGSAYAPDGTVHTLDNPSMYLPGSQVPNLTVLDFNAVWCGPCRQLAPVLESLAAEYNGRVTFVSIDVDTYPDLFAQWNVGQSIPAVVIITPDGSNSTYVGTGDLLPQSKFEEIINAKL